MKRTVCFLFFVSTLLFAQAVVPITREQHHHLALSNAYVRAFQVEVAPKSETLVHQHDYDYLFVTLGDSDVTSIRADGTRADLKLSDATVSLSRGGFAHKAINNAATPFRNVTIELLKGADATICGTSDTEPCELRESEKPYVISRQQYGMTVASIVRIGSGSTLPMHTHRFAHLAVMLDEASLVDSHSNGLTRSINAHSGDVAWVPEGTTHSLKNSGPKPVRILTLEFRDYPQDVIVK